MLSGYSEIWTMKKGVIIFGLAVLMLIGSGCITESEANISQKVTKKLSPSKYVFIEGYIWTNQEVIEGALSVREIDFSDYRFHDDTGALSGKIDFEVNESLKAVYGSGRTLSGDGSGYGSSLYGVYDLPYSHNSFILLKIDSDGTAHIRYNDASIVLSPGEKWVNQSSEIWESQFGGQLAKVNITINETITNYGILDKSKIKKGLGLIPDF